MKSFLLGLGVLLMTDTTGLAAQGTVRADTFTHGGLTRAYRLMVPATLPPEGERSLVVMLHGCTQDAADLARGTRIEQHGAEARVIVLLPEQSKDAHPQRCWNWYDSAHASREAGEAALIAGLAAQVVAEQGVDPHRVFLVGISAGGAMAANLAALFPERFAAVASHSGMPALGAVNLGEALGLMRNGAEDVMPLVARARAAMGDRARAVPFLVIHGANDAVVTVKASRALAAQWTAINVALGADASTIELRIIEGLGHAWSGGDTSGTYTDPKSPDVTADILRFLLAHPKAR